MDAAVRRSGDGTGHVVIGVMCDVPRGAAQNTACELVSTAGLTTNCMDVLLADNMPIP